ncbi:MAG: hypothetical protein KGI26_07320 [Thaumarchaeota archaeon]|nr:hypothetical protein [Nitrososphaerota archaeon]
MSESRVRQPRRSLTSMSAGATLDKMDRNPGLGVPLGSKWYTFILRRFDGTSDRMDTADPQAAAFVVRAWERDPRSRFIAMRANGDRATLNFGEKEDLSYIHDLEHAHGAPVVCHNDWCPFFPDPEFADICRKCPSGNVNG